MDWNSCGSSIGLCVDSLGDDIACTVVYKFQFVTASDSELSFKFAVFQTQIEQFHVGILIPHFKKGDFDKLLLPIPFM
jgi:hypothetical protein